jgi:hypothetical protein
MSRRINAQKRKVGNRKAGNRNPKINYHQIQRPIALAPPTYKAQENRAWVVRFSCGGTGTVGAQVNINTLAGALGIIATAATTSVFIADQFRLRRVCIWGPVATAGTPVNVMLKFVDDPTSNTQSGAPRTMQDSSVSFDRPAYVCLEPPKDNTSLFSQWADSSSTTGWIFLAAPPGSIMDLHFNFIIDDIGTTSAGPTVAGATAGTIYHKTFAVGASTWTAVSPLNAI